MSVLEQERKLVSIKKSLHHKLSLIKFYGDLDINLIASELLEEALLCDILPKVLMKLLQNRGKVEHIIKHLEQNNG